MSRGFGKLQNALLLTIRRHRKPMSFADIRAQIKRDTGMAPDQRLRASFERSLRRALQELTTDGMLFTIGDGGRGEPLRYCLNPVVIGMMGHSPMTRARRDALLADPGAVMDSIIRVFKW